MVRPGGPDGVRTRVSTSSVFGRPGSLWSGLGCTPTRSGETLRTPYRSLSCPVLVPPDVRGPTGEGRRTKAGPRPHVGGPLPPVPSPPGLEPGPSLDLQTLLITFFGRGWTGRVRTILKDKRKDSGLLLWVSNVPNLGIRTGFSPSTREPSRPPTRPNLQRGHGEPGGRGVGGTNEGTTRRGNRGPKLPLRSEDET